MTGYAAKDLLEFLEYALSKGLGKTETLKARIVSVGRIVEVVGEAEFTDVREIDTNHIMERFHNLEGTKFSPGSLASYKSRLNSSLADFIRYKENPTNYRPVRQRTRRARIDEKQVGAPTDQPHTTDSSNCQSMLSDSRPKVNATDEFAFPIPLRANHIVKLIGLPHDLTVAEATKIANVVMAMASLQE